jgi:Domain of unknown function (DUF4112)
MVPFEGPRRSLAEAAPLARAEALSHWMDTAFRVPGLGWRFGYDALLGLVPGVGDLATAAVSIYIVALVARRGLPGIVVARMSLNILLDYVVGAVPFAGDLFDVWWKTNERNMALVRRVALAPVGDPRRGTTRGDWSFVIGVGTLLLALAVVAAIAVVWFTVWITSGLTRLGQALQGGL